MYKINTILKVNVSKWLAEMWFDYRKYQMDLNLNTFKNYSNKSVSEFVCSNENEYFTI